LEPDCKSLTLCIAHAGAQLEAKHDAASALTDAANSFKKTQPARAVQCLQRSVDAFVELGRLSLAAKHNKDMAELLEVRAVAVMGWVRSRVSGVGDKSSHRRFAKPAQSLYRIVAPYYTNTANVWPLCLLQAPFSVARAKNPARAIRHKRVTRPR
jgi:hypothetical protein